MPKPRLLNRASLARALGVVQSTISRWERDGMPVATKPGRGRQTFFDVKQCRAWRRESALPSAESAVRARKELAQALEAEQRISIKAKDLVNAAEVEQVIAEEYARCRKKLLGLPRKVKAVLPHLSAKDLNVVDGLVREALEELTHG